MIQVLLRLAISVAVCIWISLVLSPWAMDNLSGWFKDATGYPLKIAGIEVYAVLIPVFFKAVVTPISFLIINWPSFTRASLKRLLGPNTHALLALIAFFALITITSSMERVYAHSAGRMSLLIAASTAIAFREQLVFFCLAAFKTIDTKAFLLISGALWIVFILLHPFELSILPGYFVLFNYWIYTSAKKNIWVGAVMHGVYNEVVFLPPAMAITSTWVMPLVILHSMYCAFGIREHSPHSLAILRTVFRFRLGRFLLLVLIHVFQAPHGIASKFFIRKSMTGLGPQDVIRELITSGPSTESSAGFTS